MTDRKGGVKMLYRQSDIEDPEITWIERTGYPSWMQETDEEDYDEDAAYEARRDERFDD